ncbi:hypothetical protein ACFU96_40385 [Streptomyces sp. NPDC057620]|uniref:hypothetical protein n=1 Tax=Streptomyces sp. NPDC057620 TaxID=3346185 RepID=UPI0036B4BDEF
MAEVQDTRSPVLGENLVGQAVLAEISRHGWGKMMCGCGISAEHVPVDFVAALSGVPPERVGEGWADNHVYIQSNLMMPAVATASTMAAALTDPLIPLMWRRSLIQVLSALCSGEQDDAAQACREAARGCTWSLYEEIGSGRTVDAAAYAFELLTAFPEEKERLGFFQKRFRMNLPQDLRSENFDVRRADW